MTLIAIDTVLRKLQATVDIGSYNALYYELLTLLSRDTFIADIKRYNQLISDSILPGKYNYNLHVQQRVHLDYFVRLREELHYKFAYVLYATKPKQHALIRKQCEEYITSCHKLITLVAKALFDPELYRIQLRYHNGSIYSAQCHTVDTNFSALNYDHYLYQSVDTSLYYVTKLDFIKGDHSSGFLSSDPSKAWEFRTLYNHLYPENAI